MSFQREVDLLHDGNPPVFSKHMDLLNEKLSTTELCLADFEEVWRHLGAVKFQRVETEIQYNNRKNWKAVARFNFNGTLICLGLPNMKQTVTGMELMFSAAYYVFGRVDMGVLDQLTKKLAQTITK